MNKEVTIAAIQHGVHPGSLEENLFLAEKGVSQAWNRGAQLAVLPELFSMGYLPNVSIFEHGEKAHGPTLSWMKETARKYGLFLGGGVAVFDNGHLYNRFYLVDPEGEICGFTQKDRAESYCFKRDEGIYIMDTPFGKVGAPICADGHFSRILRFIKREGVDLLLLPHGWPTPREFSGEKELSSLLARYFGVPVVYINGFGPVEAMDGFLGKFLDPRVFTWRGRSCICNNLGQLLCQAGSGSEVLLEKVSLQRRKGQQEIPDFQGWVMKGNPLIRRVIIPLDIFSGKIAYRRRIRRKLMEGR